MKKTIWGVLFDDRKHFVFMLKQALHYGFPMGSLDDNGFVITLEVVKNSVEVIIQT